MSKVKRAVVIGDIHYPEQHKPTINIAMDYIEDSQPDYLVLAGDQLDLNCISTFNRTKPKLIEGQRLKDDYSGFQKDILDRLDGILKRSCKRYFMYGNHDQRSIWLGESNPTLTGMVEPENCLDLSKYTVVEQNKHVKIGKAYIIHGYRYNAYHARYNLLEYNENIFSFHVHTHQAFMKTSPLDGMPKTGVSIGCACNLNPHWLQNKPNAWINQFLVLNVLNDGTFHYQTPTIIDGKTIIDNIEYKG